MDICIDIFIEDNTDDEITIAEYDSFFGVFLRIILKSWNGFVYFLFSFLLFPVVI
jgi:hypothetical protein